MKEKLLKLYSLAKANIQNIVIGALVVVIAVTFLDPNLEKTKGLLNDASKVIQKVEELKPTPKLEKLAEKEATQCTPTEAKLILSDSLIAKNMNLFVADLNNYTVKETGVIKAYHTKEQLLGVKRELIPTSKGSTQVYIAIYEPLEKLNYNKGIEPTKED